MKFVDISAANGVDVSRPARGAWVEIVRGCGGMITVESRPARGAWVEIR